MEQLTCKMCGSTDLIKQDDFFVCQSCGNKYSLEDAELLKNIKAIKNLTGSVTDSVENLANALQEQFDSFMEQDNELFVLLPQEDIDDAKYHVLEYLRDADYVSDDIFDNLQFTDVKNSFVPVVLYGGDITYHWTASSGYDREETYVEYETRTETINGKIVERKEPVTKIRIVTDWRPSSGVETTYYSNAFADTVQDDVYSDAKFRIHLGNNASKYRKKALSLYQIYKNEENGAELYGAAKSAVPSYRELVISFAKKSHGSYNIPGDHYKDLSDNADFQLESFCVIYYPIIQGQYIYNDKTYHFSVDAIDGSQNDLATEYPTQSDDKEKHELILSKAQNKKNERVAQKESMAPIIRSGLLISIIVCVWLLYMHVKKGNPSLLLPFSILVGAIVLYFALISKIKKDISNIIYTEDRNIEKVKHAIENYNLYKKELRQKQFIQYIHESGNNKFNELAKNFVVESSNNDIQEFENVSLDLYAYEEAQRNIEKTKKTSFREIGGAYSALFVLCLIFGSGFFVATILNIIAPTNTKMILGIIGTIVFASAWLFFWLGNNKAKKIRVEEQIDTKKNKIASTIGIICMCVVLLIGAFSVATPSIKKAQSYSKAESCVASGDYLAAIAVYEELGDQEKVNEYIPFAIEQQVSESKNIARQTKVGNVLIIGDYDTVVLDKQTDKILVMFLRYSGSDPSRNLNTVYQKNYDYKSSSWESSSLRSFLNGSFLDEFPESINRLILEVDLPNVTQSGKDIGTTKDKVFLLSAVSDKHYIDAIIDNGMIINSTTFTRTPADSTTVVSIDVANYFDGTGNHYAIGEQEVSNSFYIMPCMWLDIS